jgi:hypothetical protein
VGCQQITYAGATNACDFSRQSNRRDSVLRRGSRKSSTDSAGDERKERNLFAIGMQQAGPDLTSGWVIGTSSPGRGPAASTYVDAGRANISAAAAAAPAVGRASDSPARESAGAIDFRAVRGKIYPSPRAAYICSAYRRYTRRYIRMYTRGALELLRDIYNGIYALARERAPVTRVRGARRPRRMGQTRFIGQCRENTSNTGNGRYEYYLPRRGEEGLRRKGFSWRYGYRLGCRPGAQGWCRPGRQRGQADGVARAAPRKP